jgi:exonuclease VII small subunit
VTSESRSWPLLEERAPFATAGYDRRRGRKLPRSAWLLTVLAFICGGLVSAAAFSIGWRHQAQRDTAARAALAGATAHVHRLERKIGGLRASLNAARRSAASATAAQQSLAHAGANVAEEATVAGGNGTAISSGARTLTAVATRITNELKTLDTYLMTTPPGQLDPGYVATQTSYLARQLTRLQDNAGGLGDSVASFESALRKLARDASGLKAR